MSAAAAEFLAKGAGAREGADVTGLDMGAEPLPGLRDPGMHWKAAQISTYVQETVESARGKTCATV